MVPSITKALQTTKAHNNNKGPSNLNLGNRPWRLSYKSYNPHMDRARARHTQTDSRQQLSFVRVLSS